MKRVAIPSVLLLLLVSVARADTIEAVIKKVEKKTITVTPIVKGEAALVEYQLTDTIAVFGVDGKEFVDGPRELKPGLRVKLTVEVVGGKEVLKKVQILKKSD